MKTLRVKDALEYVAGDKVEVVEMFHYAGKPTRKKILYNYEWVPELMDDHEEINDKDYESREVETILAIGNGKIQIRVFPKDL